jgi:hypothetical protein
MPYPPRISQHDIVEDVAKSLVQLKAEEGTPVGVHI